MNASSKPAPIISTVDRFAGGWLPIAAAATFAQVSVPTLRRWILAGTSTRAPLPHGRFGNRLRVHETDLRAWLGEVEQAPSVG